MQNQPIWSISDINAAVKDILENSFSPFWVKGEVSNLVVHRSGHVYMSLKDERSQIRATFFGGANVVRELNLQNGALIEAQGKISVYDVRGEYQFSMRSLRLAGMGDLQIQFERLKQKLHNEGLFDQNRKKNIPQLPKRIGVVTSPTGAAIRDFLQIINRRFPNMHVQIYAAQVQGYGAAQQIAAGVDFFNRAGCDVIVVTRGGGSMEDLWAFNEEIVARAIAASYIPVVSAVGHEIDFTIADFVADLRVPTPSAAAELVIGRREELVNRVRQASQGIKRVLEYRILQAKSRLERVSNAPIFREPQYLLENQNRFLDELMMRMTHQSSTYVDRRKSVIDSLEARLNILNPKKQLERGYAMIIDNQGQLVTSVESQNVGDKISIQLVDGTIAATVSEN